MKNSMREFYEQTLLCAVATVIVLHLNSYFSKDESQTQNLSSAPARREQVSLPAPQDSLSRDSVLCFNDVRAKMMARDSVCLR